MNLRLPAKQLNPLMSATDYATYEGGTLGIFFVPAENKRDARRLTVESDTNNRVRNTPDTALMHHRRYGDLQLWHGRHTKEREATDLVIRGWQPPAEDMRRLRRPGHLVQSLRCVRWVPSLRRGAFRIVDREGVGVAGADRGCQGDLKRRADIMHGWMGARDSWNGNPCVASEAKVSV